MKLAHDPHYIFAPKVSILVHNCELNAKIQWHSETEFTKPFKTLKSSMAQGFDVTECFANQLEKSFLLSSVQRQPPMTTGSRV